MKLITLDHLPIQQKIRISMLLLAYAVLLLALSIQLINDAFNSYSTTVNEMETSSAIIASNVEAAIVFNDEDATQTMLKAFNNTPSIIFAAITTNDNKIFATYQRQTDKKESISFALEKNSYLAEKMTESYTKLSFKGLYLKRPIFMNKQKIGHIVLYSDLSKLYNSILKNFLGILFAILFSLVTIKVLTKKLQNKIALPITSLTEVITGITKHQTFDARVFTDSQDEIGQLYKGFNEMLFQISERDERLKHHRDHLENRVEERTQELNKINEELKNNIRELEVARKAAEKATEAKSMFLANMSHEIRTPMNGILGMLELIDDEQFSTEEKDYLDTAKSSANMLLQIINDILDFSKIEAGKMNLDMRAISPKTILKDVVTLLKFRAQQKQIQIFYHIDDNTPIIKGDAVRLAQILTNIIGNAIKFTEKGYVNIQLLTSTEDDNKVSLRFIIEDTGVGISVKHQSRLFQSFTQADESTTRKFGGTGLGLAISKELICLMGGNLTFTSLEGEGSTFCIFLPADIVEKTDNVDTSKQDIIQPNKHTDQFSALNVLLVEDNAVNKKLAIAMLNKLGVINIDWAPNGEEAVHFYQNYYHKYHIVFMDCQMPIMNGYKATEAIRTIEKKQGLPSMLIVAMTANAMDGDKEKCLAAGMDEFVTKPINNGTLIPMLEKGLARLQNKNTDELYVNEKKHIAFKVESSLDAQSVTQTEANHLLVNLDTYNNIKELMEEEFISLIEAYQETADELFKALQFDKLNSDNNEVLTRAAHSFKSSSLTLGAEFLGKLSQTLESLSRKAESAKIKAMIPEFNQVYKETLTIIKQHMTNEPLQ